MYDVQLLKAKGTSHCSHVGQVYIMQTSVFCFVHNVPTWSQMMSSLFLNQLSGVFSYLEGKARLLYPEPEDVFPCDIIDSELCRPPTSYA